MESGEEGPQISHSVLCQWSLQQLWWGGPGSDRGRRSYRRVRASVGQLGSLSESQSLPVTWRLNVKTKKGRRMTIKCTVRSDHWIESLACRCSVSFQPDSVNIHWALTPCQELEMKPWVRRDPSPLGGPASQGYEGPTELWWSSPPLTCSSRCLLLQFLWWATSPNSKWELPKWTTYTF